MAGFKALVGVFAAGSLMVSSSGALATTATASPQPINAWATLTYLSGGAPAAAVCGAAAVAAAAQAPAANCVLPAMDAPPPVASSAPPPPTPVPPVSPPSSGLGLGISPILLGLLAVAAGVGLYFLLKNDHHHSNSPA